MIALLDQMQTPTTENRLLRRLAKLGITMGHLGPDGRLRVASNAPLMESLLAQSPAFAAAAAGLFSQLRDKLGTPVTIWPGVNLIALPMQRRRRIGHDDMLNVAILLTDELLASDQFRLLCDTAGVDFQDTLARLSRTPFLQSQEMQRLASMLAWMRDDAVEIEQRTGELQALSSELADSYEELSLLYKLSCSMTFNQSPHGFIVGACRDLQEVVDLRWMTLRLSDNARFNTLCGAIFNVGHSKSDEATLHRIGQALLQRQPPIRQLMVLEGAASMGIAELNPLVTNLLIVPLVFEGQSLGVIFGGDKIDGTPISSEDAKLVTSLANSLAIFLQNTLLYEDMEGMFMGTLKALTNAIDAKDSYTHGHTERVAMLARQLAEAMNMDGPTAERVYLSGLLHDVGKIGVPEAVLTKPGALTDDEFELIKMHPEIGARILRDIRPMQDLIPGVLYHHERWDGRGYPHQLAGEEIPLFGRILCLADSFDAMSSNRTYRNAMPHDQVLAQIRQHRGSQFDPALSEIFLKLNFESFFSMAEKHKQQQYRQCA